MIKGQALCPRHKPAGHACTVTAWTADIPADLHRITYVQFGFQERPKAAGTFNDPLAWPGQVEVEETPAALGEMRAWFSLPNGPKHLDCGVFVDDRGARNWIFFAYWLDDDRYAAWPGHTLFDQAASDLRVAWRQWPVARGRADPSRLHGDDPAGQPRARLHAVLHAQGDRGSRILGCGARSHSGFRYRFNGQRGRHGPAISGAAFYRSTPGHDGAARQHVPRAFGAGPHAR